MKRIACRIFLLVGARIQSCPMSRRFGWMQPTGVSVRSTWMDLAGLLGFARWLVNAYGRFCHDENLKEVSLSDVEVQAFASTMEAVLKQEVREE